MPEGLSREDAQYAIGLVDAICTQVGPGLPGSDQERQRGEMIRQEMESLLGAEKVCTEEFTLAPKAFQGVLRTSALLLLIAAVLNIVIGYIPGIAPWLTATSSFAVAFISTWLVLNETILYRECIDPILKQETSQNVIGAVRKPGTENVGRLLIVSGHHDSALEFTWLRFLSWLERSIRPGGQPGRIREDNLPLILGYVFLFLTVTMFIGPVIMLAASAIQLVGVLAGSAGIIHFGTLGWVAMVYPIIPSIMIGLTYTRGWKKGGNVPGAADNLAASAVAVAMCRFLVKNPDTIPDNTEIRFISFGSEEAGLRGSRRYVKRHLEELKALDVHVLNFEVIASPEINILTTDVTGVKNSPEIIKSVTAAAERAGVPYQVKANPTSGGGSDAGAFSQAGLKAITLQPMRMPHQMIAFYHQKWDAPEVLSIEPILNVLQLTFDWIRHRGD